MLLPEQVDFYTRWMAKANGIPMDNIHNCIDKYVTLFISYNALYNTVQQKIAVHKGVAVKNIGDKRSATIEIRNFLDARYILAELTVQKNDAHINELIQTMQLKLFNIKLDGSGNAQPLIDNQLETGLSSLDADTKTLALLEVIYYVRCNIVHGHKNLQPYQTLLLEPLIPILTTINQQLFTALNAFPI